MLFYVKILQYPSLIYGWTGGDRTHDLRLNRPLLLPAELPSNINKAVNHQKAPIFYIFIINLLEIFSILLALPLVWYGRWDSNPHAIRHQILSLGRLPFRHSRIYALTSFLKELSLEQ